MRIQLTTRINYALSLFMALMLPVWPRIVPFIVTAMTLNWFVSGKFIAPFRKGFEWKFLLLFIAPYLLCVAGVLWTKDMDGAMPELMTRLSLLIYPLIFFTFPNFNKEEFIKIIKTFVLGCLVASAVCFGTACWNYFSTKYAIAHGSDDWDFGINWFLKDRISIWMHPSYRAMYFVLTIIFFDQIKSELFRSRIVRIICSAVLAFFILLFSSKAGILALIVYGIYSGYRMMIYEKRVVEVVSGVAVFLFVFFALYAFAPQFSIRIKDAWKAVTGQVEIKNTEESTAERMAIWKASKTVISTHFILGAGSGYSDDLMVAEYEKEGMITAAKERLNTHNQFLQAFVEYGLIGFLVFLLSLFIPMINMWRRRSFLYVFFILLFIVNVFVESMLEAQAGVIFFAFFNSLIFTFYNKKTE